MEEEATIKEVIRGYKALKEKDDPGSFVLPIRLEAKFDYQALADTGSNITVMTYHIYVKLGREEAKLVNRGITMLNHSKVEPMGIIKDVICQARVTTIITKFLILDMPVDKDVPIVVGRGFLFTCGSILNTAKGTTSTFDGVCYQKIYLARVKKAQTESDDDDDEDYCIKRNEMGAPIYGLKFAKYLNCNDPMDRALAL
ncbi:DNA-directed DNA polymerase [Tanacetum coccineum]